MKAWWLLIPVLLILASTLPWGDRSEEPIDVAIIWHQHQPLYWNRLTQTYDLPWVRVHGVQEYIDSARILAEYPDVRITFNLQPSLLWQLADYCVTTSEELLRHDLYQHIGAIDNHLTWMWTLATDPVSLDPADRAALEEQVFWLNGYMFDEDDNDPYYDPVYARLRSTADDRALSDAELLDASALFLLWQISPELHAELGLSGYRSHQGFGLPDLVTLIEAQRDVLNRVVDAYADVAELGNELITGPYYHPILPLLCQHGWADDALAQMGAGLDQHVALFGSAPRGVWPSEQAVSEQVIRLIGEAGFSWTTTDETILGGSLAHSPTPREQTTVYRYDGVALFFRETELSNRISLAYGNRPTQDAVQDLLEGIESFRASARQRGSRVLTLAADGENWMFMAGYPDNGRAFLRALYAALSDSETIRTVTPSQVLDEGCSTKRLRGLPTGSWAGDLSTWAGEPDEDEAWSRLAEARRVVEPSGSTEAWEALYAAQGSDWFWWYGTDQESGTDEIYDALFKANLTAAYRAAGATETEIPGVLSIRLVPPIRADLGEASPQLDGKATEDEDWSSAAHFASEGILGAAELAYQENLLLVRVTPSESLHALREAGAFLMLYVSGPAGTRSVARSRYAGQTLGFPIAYAAQIDLSKLREDGSGAASVYAPNASGAWTLASPLRSLTQRRVQAESTIEFTLPFTELGLEPGKSATLMLVLERDGEVVDVLHDRPILAAIPTLIQGVLVHESIDPSGDDRGTGTFVYPTEPLFDQAGLFDLLRYAVYDTGDKWQFAFDFGSLPNPWNGPQGFSHPLIFLYLDVEAGGLTQSHEQGDAARVVFDPDHPWDRFIKIAGWPAYGRHLWTAGGEGPFLVEVAADPKRARIIASVSKTLLPEIAGHHYVMVLSQDGYGASHARPVAGQAGTWIGGGIPDEGWAPLVYDLLAPSAEDQYRILGSYGPGIRYAELRTREVSP